MNNTGELLLVVYDEEGNLIAGGATAEGDGVRGENLLIPCLFVTDDAPTVEEVKETLDAAIGEGNYAAFALHHIGDTVYEWPQDRHPSGFVRKRTEKLEDENKRLRDPVHENGGATWIEARKEQGDDA